MIEEEMAKEPAIEEHQAAENQALIAQFEQGRAPEGFHHADHVRVAFAYISEFPLLEALARFSSALRRFAQAQGKPGLYHETITWAYLFLIAERIAISTRLPSWEEFSAQNPDVLVWRGGIVEKYYTKSTLNSDLARQRFVLPDRGFLDCAILDGER